MKRAQFPLRVGTTSYIIPADILPNVRRLAERVDDVELVIFELDHAREDVLPAETIRELAALRDRHGLSYTVHLPLDLRLGAGGDARERSLVKARRAIEATSALDPWAYVLHLDGREVGAASRAEGAEALPGSHRYRAWVDASARALETAARWAGGAERLAVENLEGDPLDLIEPVLERVPASRCVDVGHLWLDGHDPLPYLEARLPRTRVIHLHGIRGRDHRSLEHADPGKLAAVARLLLRESYGGVVTIEVFSEDDFSSSLTALGKAVEAAWAQA